MKTCVKCNKPLNLSEFHKDKNNKDGYKPSCKLCVKEYKQKFYLKNKESLSDKAKKRYEKDKEKIKEKTTKYYNSNKNSISIKRKINRNDFSMIY
jgi:predicted transcriptional regulator